MRSMEPDRQDPQWPPIPASPALQIALTALFGAVTLATIGLPIVRTLAPVSAPVAQSPPQPVAPVQAAPVVPTPVSAPTPTPDAQAKPPVASAPRPARRVPSGGKQKAVSKNPSTYVARPDPKTLSGSERPPALSLDSQSPSTQAVQSQALPPPVEPSDKSRAKAD